MGLGSYVPDGQGYGGVRLDDSNWQGDQENAFARFRASPDYNFRLQQGQKALDQSAALSRDAAVRQAGKGVSGVRREPREWGVQ